MPKISPFRYLAGYVFVLILRLVWFIDYATQSIFSNFAFGILVLMFALTLYPSTPQFIEHLYEGSVLSTQSGLHISSNVLGNKSSRLIYVTLVNQIPFPQVSALSYLVADGVSGQVFTSKDHDKRYASASTTKLMTAIVAIETYDLDSQVVVSDGCASLESTKANLPTGVSFKVMDLVSAMLVSSAGDAACALAESEGNPSGFVYKMNAKAQKLQMDSTYYTNAVGLDGENSSHFSTASDLFKLATASALESTIAQAIKTKSFNIKSADGRYIGVLQNTNKLLWEIPQTAGVKTGTTAEAGEVFIYRYLDQNKDLYIVVMGSKDRFSDTRALLNWTIASYDFSN